MSEYKKLGRWQLCERLGKGGNGLVYRAHCGDTTVAVKLLRKPERVGRFTDEIECMKRLVGTSGVLPVLDSNVPDQPTKSNPAWFAMPLATPLIDALGPSPTSTEVISTLKTLASVLADLHVKGFSHRDIKPDNLFKHEDKWVVGDFGLVDFVGKSHETVLGERIGPMHFIAPEMLLGLQDADGKAADVYSLAKTLWVLLTGANFPVPGAYNATSPICKLKSYVSVDQSSNLDRFIEQCTATEPDSRPSMDAVERELSAWLGPQQSGAGAPPLNTVVPTGPEWAEVLEAFRVQDLDRATHTRRHSDAQAAVNDFYGRIRPLYLELQELFKVAHLADITGPDNKSSPPGVSASFPVRSTPERRLSLEFRIWFNPDWQHLERNTVDAVALARLNVSESAGSAQEEIYRLEDSFLIGGLTQDGFIERVKHEVHHLLGSWLEQGRRRWIALG